MIYLTYGKGMFKGGYPMFEPIKRTTLTVPEIAEYIGISTDMVYLLVRERRIDHIRVGRRILFRRSDIDRWLDKNMVEVAENE